MTRKEFVEMTKGTGVHTIIDDVTVFLTDDGEYEVTDNNDIKLVFVYDNALDALAKGIELAQRTFRSLIQGH